MGLPKSFAIYSVILYAGYVFFNHFVWTPNPNEFKPDEVILDFEKKVNEIEKKYPTNSDGEEE